MKNKIPGLSTRPFAGRPFLLVLFIFIEIFIVLYFLNDYRKHDNKYREHLLRAFDAGYRGATSGYDLAVQVIFNDEVNKPEALKLLASALDDYKKRDVLRNELHRLILPSYERQKALGIWQVHFHLKDGTSFLRMHAPEKFGDNLFRRTAVYEVNKKQVPVKGYEVGYFADGYRFMYPLFNNGRHVGSIEFGITAEGIINHLNQIFPAQYLFMINRTIVDNMTYADWKKRNYRESGLSDDFMIGQDAVEDTIVASINQKLRNKVRDRLAGMQRFVEKGTADGKDYLVAFLPVQDVKGDTAAYFVQYINDSYLAHQFRTTMTDITLFSLLLAAIFYSIDNIQSRQKSLEQKNSELERMAKTLRESEIKYREMFESATDAIFILDMDGSFIDVNSVAYSRLGYSKEEMLAMHVSQLDPPEFAAKVPERLAQLRDRGFAVFETAHVKKDGTVMPVEVNARLYAYEGKKVFLSFIRDITERKKAEEKLRESENRFRGAFENVSFGASIVNLNGQFLRVNQALCRMLGYSMEELLSMTFSDITHPDDVQIGLDALNKQLSGECDFMSFEKRYLRKNGTVLNVIISPAVIRDNLGNPQCFVALFQDITERKKVEEQIQKSLKEKETLIREVHHRVKNNMQVITSLLKLQAQKIQDKELRKPFEESEQRIRAMALVHERLYQKEDLSGINFSDYIHHIIRELKAVYSIDVRKIAVKINVEDIVLEVDSAIPCGLIINELITNCFKYAFPGDRTGEVVVSFTKEGNTYRLSIRDNGVGLPAGFDYRQTSTLGMEIVNVLTKQLLGTLNVRSDGGTEVFIAFTKKERIDGNEENTDS